MKRPWLGVGLVTARYPAHAEAPPAARRGRPALDPQRCTGDAACVLACPTQAITLEPWRVDLGRCLFCGACAAACPEQAITMTAEVELATRQRADLVVDGQGQPVAAALTPDLPTPKRARHLLPMLPDGELAALQSDLQTQITQGLRRSLHIRHLDAGSCNGCDWELTTLLNPVHDVQRLGIDRCAVPPASDCGS